MNDSILFEWEGTGYKLYHSSFGFGWRACHPPDCVQVQDAMGGSVTEDGCTKERTIPAICKQVKQDGTIDALTDTFEPCDGDPNYE